LIDFAIFVQSGPVKQIDNPLNWSIFGKDFDESLVACFLTHGTDA